MARRGRSLCLFPMSVRMVGLNATLQRVACPCRCGRLWRWRDALFEGPLQSFFQDCGTSLLSGGLGCFQLRATSHPPDLARAETRPFPQGAPPNKDPSKLARSFFGTRAD